MRVSRRVSSREDTDPRRVVLRGTGPAPAGYVRCAAASCPAEGPHFHPQIDPGLVPAPAEHPAATIDRRPGFYYVTAIDGDRYVRVRGPFPRHRDALRAVSAAKADVAAFDSRAPWYAWGTARAETDLGPGVLEGPLDRGSKNDLDL